MGCLLEDSYVQSFVMGWMVGGSFCVNRSFFSIVSIVRNEHTRGNNDVIQNRKRDIFGIA